MCSELARPGRATRRLPSAISRLPSAISRTARTTCWAAARRRHAGPNELYLKTVFSCNSMTLGHRYPPPWDQEHSTPPTRRHTILTRDTSDAQGTLTQALSHKVRRGYKEQVQVQVQEEGRADKSFPLHFVYSRVLVLPSFHCKLVLHGWAHLPCKYGLNDGGRLQRKRVAPPAASMHCLRCFP